MQSKSQNISPGGATWNQWSTWGNNRYFYFHCHHYNGVNSYHYTNITFSQWRFCTDCLFSSKNKTWRDRNQQLCDCTLTSLTLRGLTSPFPPVMSCLVTGLRGAQSSWSGSMCVFVCVRLAVGGEEEEDQGDPICLFCPPDVSESRLRDLAWGGGGTHLNSPTIYILAWWRQTRGGARRNQDTFFCFREKPPQWYRWTGSYFEGGNEDEGLGDRKRKTGSHVFTQWYLFQPSDLLLF